MSSLGILLGLAPREQWLHLFQNFHNYYQSALHNIPEDLNVYWHHCENLKCDTMCHFMMCEF